MNEELISLIVPVYNVEKFLRYSLESVINQSYKNLEIIIVNDGSKDNQTQPLIDETGIIRQQYFKGNFDKRIIGYSITWRGV